MISKSRRSQAITMTFLVVIFTIFTLYWARDVLFDNIRYLESIDFGAVKM
jgi:hypothetical protein